MSSARITSRRQLNGYHAILVDGVKVGEAHRLRGSRKFGLHLNGYYWRRGEPNTRSGSTGISVPTLRAAVALANTVLCAADGAPSSTSPTQRNPE